MSLLGALKTLTTIDVDQFNTYWRQHIRNDNELEQATDTLLQQLSLDEKLAQLHGDGGLLSLIKLGIYVMGLKRFPNMYAGYNPSRRIPPLSFSDGPRGVVIGRATAFPAASLRGASFDTALEREIGQAIGRELRASHANYYGGLCVNLLRHPAWGRAQETFGEDSYHLAAMGTATMQGVQHAGAMVCAKHFAVNSIENSRFYLDVSLDEQTLHEVYLPHFKALVDAGVDSLMSAYNQVNGEFCGHSAPLLDDILRQQWHFKGFVSSDWLWGIYHTVKPALAGMEVEMPVARYYGRRLRRAVKQGQISELQIDQLARRVLRGKLHWASRAESAPSRTVIACAEHQQLAERAAQESIVLLQNRAQTLPLANSARVLLLGALAEHSNLGDFGSSRVSPPTVTTIKDALLEHFPNARYSDSNDPEHIRQLAQDADCVVVVAGYLPEQEGENLVSNHRYQPEKTSAVTRGGDRQDLHLPADQAALLDAATAAHPQTIAAIVSGSAVYLDRWREQLTGIFWLGYPGMRGGSAFAKLLSGAANPCGHLPFVMPTEHNTLPPFDRHAPCAHYGYFHGYALLDHLQQQPAFHFGHGLSYSDFTLDDVQLKVSEQQIRVRGLVRNRSERAGKVVVQCYISQAATRSHYLPVKRLAGFCKLTTAGMSDSAFEIHIETSQLARFIDGHWQCEPGAYRALLGFSANPQQLLPLDFTR